MFLTTCLIEFSYQCLKKSSQNWPWKPFCSYCRKGSKLWLYHQHVSQLVYDVFTVIQIVALFISPTGNFSFTSKSGQLDSKKGGYFPVRFRLWRQLTPCSFTEFLIHFSYHVFDEWLLNKPIPTHISLSYHRIRTADYNFTIKLPAVYRASCNLAAHAIDRNFWKSITPKPIH